MKKKLLGMVFAAVATFGLMTSVSATTFTYDGWVAQGGYGSKEKIDDNVTNLKGMDKNEDIQLSGPNNKQSKQTVKDGINENIYIELDPEKFAEGENFKLSLALNDHDDNNYIEAIVQTKKVGDKLEVLTFGTPVWAPEFKAEITEAGVYTFNYKIFLNEDGNVYANFTVLNYGKVIDSTGDINMDDFPDATIYNKKPIAEHVKNVRYIWFSRIEVAEGVNVYQNLPTLPVKPSTPVEPVVTTQAKEKNPNTSDNMPLYLMGLFAGVAGLGLCAKKLVRR